MREWNGDTHTVLVHADGVEWRGQRYRSLSVVAREITGAHWSGSAVLRLDLEEGEKRWLTPIWMPCVGTLLN